MLCNAVLCQLFAMSRYLAFEYTGTGLMAFAELGIAFPVLTMDHLLLWPDLEKKLEVWNELDLPIDLVTERREKFLSNDIVQINRKYNYFRMSNNALSKFTLRCFMRCGADLDTLTPTTSTVDRNKTKVHALLHRSLDCPHSFDQEATKAILARFVEPRLVERNMGKQLVKYVHSTNLNIMLCEAIVALRTAIDNEQEYITVLALMKFLINECGVDATNGLVASLPLSGLNAATVKILVMELGANANAMVMSDYLKLKQTPLLHLVCMTHNVEAVHAMLECGAQVNQRDSEGNSELMRVMVGDRPSSGGSRCKSDGFGVAKVLLEAGSSTDMKNHAGETPLSSTDRCGRSCPYKQAFLAHKERMDIEAALEFGMELCGDVTAEPAMTKKQLKKKKKRSAAEGKK